MAYNKEAQQKYRNGPKGKAYSRRQNQNYWKRHGKEESARHRKRYASDVVYRTKVIAGVMKTYTTNKHYTQLIKRKYGLTVSDVDAMRQRQNDCCSICGRPAENNRYKRLNIDHCHETNKVRALLCDLCNKGLGMFHDNPELLQKASEYLIKWR